MDVVPIGTTTLKTLGLEVEPATGKLKEAATRQIADPPASTMPRRPQKRRTHLTQHRRQHEPSVDDVLSCLQKYDETRQDF